MCGIIGYVGKEKAASHLLKGIKKLEYRGYDSVGMVTFDDGFHVKKDVGEVDIVDKKVHFLELPGIMGISHSRWATHGGVTKENAHPHLSCDGRVVIVHNGIIENYLEMKKELEKKGCVFKSQTDSEVVAHFIEHRLEKNIAINDIITDFIATAQGTFAILFMVKGDHHIYALRRDSPLVLGVGKNENYLGSDIYAFSDKTNHAVFFENDEFAVVDSDSYSFFDKKGRQIKKEIKTFVWEEEDAGKKEYDHFMLKEIMEEPVVVKRMLTSLETDQKQHFGKLISLIKSSHKIVFVAAGSSYHATLLGTYYLHKCGVEAQTLIASEFEHFAHLDETSLVIAFSQSGETMDVIDALKYAQSKKAKIASVVNVPYSTVQRMSELSLNILAGQEVCVAATKSFVNQVVLLLKIAREFGLDVNVHEIPDKIKTVFQKVDTIKKIGKSIAKTHDLYILGRGLSYPVAREMALKIKEISYIHAEGMMGGELKHGTIALIEEGTPVISLISNADQAMLSNTKEVEARGARVIVIGTDGGDLVLPTKHDGTFGVLASVAGQLLTYYVALEKKLPIDKPKNLAKCVSVR